MRKLALGAMYAIPVVGALLILAGLVRWDGHLFSMGWMVLLGGLFLNMTLS